MSLKKIDQLHPAVKDEVGKAYLHINRYLLGKGVRFEITQGLRTFAEQDTLYDQGRTTKGSKVTNAKGGQSIHNFGLAIDFAIYYDLNNDGVFEKMSWDIKKDFDSDGTSNWMVVVKYFKSLGWEWGGDWKSIIDYPHFEKRFNFNHKQLLYMHNKKDFIPGTKFVRLV